MADRSIFLLLVSFCFFFINPCISETDTLPQGQELKNWDELTSSNKVFSLKLFGFGTMVSPYLGIFYNNLSTRAVWVANRNNPIPDMYGKLMIDVHGKLSLLSSEGTVVVLFNPTSLVTCNASAKLLDTGNLVLQELYPDGSVKQVLWQSFDYPTDTLLPGMKLGINFKTGHRWSLSSWTSAVQPATGCFTVTGERNGKGKLVIRRGGSSHWRSGPWQNGDFKNTRLQSSGSDVRLYYVSNETEQYFMYLTKSYDSFPALRMTEDGVLKGTALNLYVHCHITIDTPGCLVTDTLHQGQELKDRDELVSSNRVFSLKFFGFGTTISPYLGVFYNDNSSMAVWVANRNNPILDIYGHLKIDVNGKMSIISSVGTVLNLFSPGLETRNARARLLDSGNFVLQEVYPDGSVKQVLWQSFDYQTDTLLPGMKLGINLKTGHRWSLTSWRNNELPAEGLFMLTGDLNGTGQMVILRQGNINWRSGPWQNGQFMNTNLSSSGPDVRLYYVSNETEHSFMFLTRTYHSFPALRMYQDGQLSSFTLNLNIHCRSIDFDVPPGCAENEFEKLKCRKGYYFELQKGSYNLGDEYVYDESYNLNLYDCQRICWSNCSCVACTSVTKNRVGCKTYGKGDVWTWSHSISDGDPGYYLIRYNGVMEMQKEKKKKIWIWLIIMIGTLGVLISCCLGYKKLDVQGKAKKIKKLLLHQIRHFYNYLQREKNINSELHYFTFQSISSATDNFSSSNKLGEGGFGSVYKGKLVDGQEIAVKRLSRSSGQGVKEFKNETELIAKLQHTNLVRLLGCCVEKQEKILIYEYMPNNSLDFFLFDPRRKGLLDWNNRFVIIDGIAQGLLYLHKFSRLRVIHRDLKASNILLDDYMKPKISDFGMAKLFGINESEANTSRVVGTRGYMPPEYLIDGIISTKIDVFGFGVLLLEVVSSKMNHGSYDSEHPLNLLGLAWELWNEGRGLELMDPILEDSCTPKEVMTCIHVGLLCVQDHAMDRPTMSEVISMLTNENMNLPEPKRPAFFIERHESHPEARRRNNLENGSVNGQSISILVAR